MQISTRLSSLILSLIFMNFARMSANGKMRIVKSGLIFNFGIIWNTFSPLIIVYGITLLFSFGLRGGGGLFEPEFFVFIFLFWINFLNIIQTLLIINIEDKFYKNKDFGNLFIISLASVITSMIQGFMRFFLTLLIIYFIDLEIDLFVLLNGFFIMNFYGILVGYFLKFSILSNTIIQNLISYSLQALFFISNIIFPVSIFPSYIQKYLYLNPFVHLNEFIRESYLGTFGGFVNMSYVFYMYIPLILIVIFISLVRLDLILPKQ